MEFQLEFNQIDAIVEPIINSLKKGFRIFLFSGEVGSGKTSLIKVLGKQLGVNSAIQSPTYGIVHQYESETGIINHSDWYRLNNIKELYEMGIHEDLEYDFWFIEWPEIGMELVSEFPHVHIQILAPENPEDPFRNYQLTINTN